MRIAHRGEPTHVGAIKDADVRAHGLDEQDVHETVDERRAAR
jgi:hypothetical protein